ncbi:MAG: D-2-hydroxyacid dehydrogenase, partial [Bacteroidetes bacterium]|nr:D-2-hydroxyacid dehydrogenase [Bacteroidota bacterium]
MKLTILDGQTLNPGDLSWEAFHSFGKVDLYEHTSTDKVLERSLEADILIINKVVLDAELISCLPNLKFVAVTATGFNNIDVSACNERGIPVSNVRNYASDTVAQHVFALLLALTNRAERHADLVRGGQWEKSGAFSFWQAPLVELSGKTMGIIGYGNIGRSVASIANGFGMKVLYHSSSGQSGEPGTAVDLQTLLHQSDVISLHTHLHEGNHKMVDS